MATMTLEQTTNGHAAQQPDISYHPDFKKWQARTARRLSEEPSLPTHPLPAGFPKKMEGPLVWDAKDWKNESQWVYQLSSSELNEIEDAVKHFQSSSSSCFIIISNWLHRLIAISRSKQGSWLR